jgi:hypothetical protein
MRTDDRLNRLISQWLERRLGNAELLRGIEESGSEELAPGQAKAVAALAKQLARAKPSERGKVEVIARQTLEVLALGE